MGNNKYKILIIEDDVNICSFVEAILETNGYAVISAASCGQGISMFLSHNPDLVILDLGLPDKDGMEFIRIVREKSTVPIIVLSARTAEADKITALDMGANDYISKPFGTGELMARIRASLRSSRISTGTGTSYRNIFKVGGMSIDYDRRQVMIDGSEIKLTQTEYNIVAFLSEHQGKVMTYAAIIRAIWGTEDSGSIKKLQVNMANIRKKLGIKPGSSHYILNELGVGYRMADDE